MTKLLDKGIEAVRALPEDRQDIAGEILLALAEQGDVPRYRLTPEQVEGIKEAQAQVARGEYASDEDVEAVFGKRFV